MNLPIEYDRNRNGYYYTREGVRPHSSLDDLTPDEIYFEPEKSPESLLETVAEIWT